MSGRSVTENSQKPEPVQAPETVIGISHADVMEQPDEFKPSASEHFPARRLLWLTVCFTAGIAIERIREHNAAPLPWLLAGILIFLLATYLILRKFIRKPPPEFLLPAVLFLVCGYVTARGAIPTLPFPGQLEPFFQQQMIPYIAEVSAPPEHFPDKTRIPLLVISALVNGNRIPVGTKAILTTYDDNSDRPPSFWLPGDRLIVRMSLKPFRNFKNPGAFDYLRYQAERGFYASAYLNGKTFITRIAPTRRLSPGSFLTDGRRQVELFRQKALLWLRSSLDAESAGFYAALLLGYQNFLDKAWQDRVQRTGLNHLLTVSGFHLGLIAMLIFCLVRYTIRIVCPRILNRISAGRIAVLPALACAVGYAFLAGFGVPPIWRSVLMLTVGFCAALRYRFPDHLTVLALAALIILLYDPNSLWHISFQLTFACLLSIILIYPRLCKLKLAGKLTRPGYPFIIRPLISTIEDGFWLSVAVSVLVLPLTVYHFNGFSLASLAANIILVPLTGWLVLPMGLFSLAVFAVSEDLALPLIKAGEHLLSICLCIIKWFDGLSWSYLWTGSMSLLCLFSIYCTLLLILAPITGRKRLAGIIILSMLLFGHSVWVASSAGGTAGTLVVDVIDVGQGSAALVRFPAGETMLVDGGGFRDDSFDVGKLVLAPFLWHSGIRRLDHVVLSHDHPDHRNGLRFLLSHFQTGTFWTTGRREDMDVREGQTRHLEDIAYSRGIAVRSFPELAEPLSLGTARVWVRNPNPEYLQQRQIPINDLSLVLEIVYGDTTLVLPGDISAKVEKTIASAFEKSRRVLLVGAHHGSSYSNCEEFLDMLSPQAIIFSCGFGNSFGFPAPSVIQRCKQRHIPFYRTDLDGAVHAVSNGQYWAITTVEKRRVKSPIPHALIPPRDMAQ